MPDQRSVMKEFRSLEQKRASEGLSPAEEARLAHLRELVGPEAGAGGLRGGFDVTAAAARLRDSLLPAGLRNRPPPQAEAEAEPENVPVPELSPSDALTNAYAEQPFAPLQPGDAADALFDPASLGLDAPAPGEGVLAAEWNAGAAPETYDAASAGHDPAGAAYDPNAQAYAEAAAPAWDPNAPAAWDASQAYDPNAQDAAQPYDAGAAQAWDPNAQPYAEGDVTYAAPYDPNAQPYDPAATASWDPNAQPYDPAATASWDPNAQPYDPAAAAGWDPNAPADPGAATAWDASQGYDPNAQLAAPAYDPNAPAPDASAPPAWDAHAEAAVDVAFEAFAAAPPEPPSEEASGWDASTATAPEPAAAYENAPDAAALAPEGWDVAPPGPEAAARNVPLGEYDDSGSAFPPGEDAGLESALPFDAAAGASLGEDVPQPAGVPALGEYDDTAGFSGTAFPEAPPADLPVEGGGFEAASAVAPEASEGWHPEDAVDDGFQLESGGSFDAAAEAVAPEWAVADAPPWDVAAPAEAPPGTEPPLDAAPEAAWGEAAPQDPAYAEPELPQPELGAAPDAEGSAVEVGPADGELGLEPEAHAPELSGPAPALDFSRPDLSEGQPEDDFAPPQAIAPEPTVAAEEEIPTIDGEEILEEIPADDGAAAPARSLEFEPLVVAPPPPPAPPPVPVAPPAPAHAERFVEGVHRVVVHTVEGQVKRGVLEDADLAAPTLGLAPQPGGAPELVEAAKVKAIFFMLAPGESAPAAEGKKVRVTFRDGRQIAGFSPDYDETGPGFFMIPGDTRTNTGRIWVYRGAVKQVSVS